MDSPLLIKDALLHGWNTFKKRPWIFVQAAFVLIAISIVFNVAGALLTGLSTLFKDSILVIIPGLLYLALVVVSIYVSITVNNMGFISFYMKAHEDVSSIRLKDLYRPHPLKKYVISMLLLGLAVLVGLLLLVIPGIIIALIFSMNAYLVLDRGLGPVEALKESARITKGSRLKLFLLLLVVFGLNVLGALPLFLGLLVTLPITMLAFVYAYRTLAHHAGEMITVPAPAA